MTQTETRISGPHREAPEYGGATYYTCEVCGREAIGSPRSILHDRDCPVGNNA